MINRDDLPYWALIGLVIVALFMVAMSKAARSDDLDGRYSNSPNHEWFLKAELTEAAQKRFGFKSCCAHSDVVKTRFRPAAADDGWDYLDGATWRQVPPDIIHAVSAPGGEPIMFAVQGKPTCFFPPQGGI